MRSLQQHHTLPSVSDPPSPPPSVDSDIAVILAALLCALICVVGLALVARCAWFHRSPPSSFPPPTKGIKKKVLNSLPKLSFRKDLDISADCPICLAEFVGGDEIRILPQCGHGFHVGCVDTWLGSRSSCPSCRRVLVAAKVGEMQREEENRCRIGCGAEEDERRDDGNHFLP